MALSGKLGEKGMTAKSLNTTATVSLEKQDGGFTITAVHLALVANIFAATFREPDVLALGNTTANSTKPT